MEDGTEQELLGHLREAHHKGTRGLTEKYLSNLHRGLHQRTPEDAEPVHSHPEIQAGYPEDERPDAAS